MSGDKKPVFGYWAIRGLAGPARLMLHYAKVDFEDKLYTQGGPPDYDRSSWYVVKFNLGLPFPNLPYYVDGDLKICQSSAIYRHIARKHGLVADDEASRVRQDMVEQQLVDLRDAFFTLGYFNYDTGKDAFFEETQPTYLKQFEEFLGDNDWFAGKKLTFVDFMAWEVFDHQRVMNKFCLKDFSNLAEFMARFEALPEMKEYFSLGEYKKLPLNSRNAKYGGTMECYD